jgi:hypothetical protein
MATVTKDFRVKHGLVVEGENGTINGSDIITEDAIVGGTQTNIIVTYNPTTKVVDFVAENGVSDSTTDDLVEGETNLYFTDQRAIDAVGGSATPNNEPNTVVKRDANGDFAAENITLENRITAQGVTANGFTLPQLLAGPSGEFAVIAGSPGATFDSVPTINSYKYTVGLGDLLARKTADASGDTEVYVDVIKDAQGGVDGTEVYLGTNSSEDNLIATHGHIDSLIGDATVDGTGGNTVTDRIATAVSNLVDGAPELLDTLNELAAALGDDENFATTVATDIGTKVGKAGDSMTGELAMGTNKITGLGTPTSDADAATKLYVDTAETDAVTSANTYTDGRETAITTAYQAYADALETDDVAEGATNLYFTDVRAVDALEAVVPNFTAVEVNSVAKQVAATVSAPTSGDPVTAYAFAKATYRSAKFLVKVAYSTHTEVSEVLLTLDTSDNIAITEFAIVSTNGSASGISAVINDSNVELLVTPTNASSTVTVVGTLLA